jgi:hypothetical protein
MATTVPPKYQPDERLIDDREELAQLYNERELTVRAIANDHAEVSVARVYQALKEHGIVDPNERDTSSRSTERDVVRRFTNRHTPRHENHGERGIDPPSPDWGRVA